MDLNFLDYRLLLIIYHYNNYIYKYPLNNRLIFIIYNNYKILILSKYRDYI
jgi:hypothetical protein